MEKSNINQCRFTCFIIWMMVCTVGLFSTPVNAQTTKVSEVQQLINNVPANGKKVIDLAGKTYQQAAMLEISGGRKITLKNGTLLRNEYYSPVTFISVSDSYLTLESVLIDGNEKNKNSVGPLIRLRSSELTVKAGTVITHNDITSSVTAGGVIVDGSSSFVMTGGEIHGSYDYDMGQVYVAPGGKFNMTGGEISSVCASSENTPADVIIGGTAKITSYFRLYAGSYLKLSSALQNKIPVRNTSSMVTTGTIAATGTGGYSPTMSDVGKFEDYEKRWFFDLKDGNIIFTGKSSIVNSEDDLQKKIDAAPVGSQSNPTTISIGEVEIKNGVVINGKYITFNGGKIVGNSSNNWISVKSGGLSLDQIVVRNKTSLKGSPIQVEGNGIVVVNTATIESDYATGGVISMDGQTSTVIINNGVVNGIIFNNHGSLTIKEGTVHSLLSLVPIKLSGNVQVSGLISCELILTSIPKYKLSITKLNQSSNVIASGGNGFILEERYLSMFECVDSDSRFVWKNNQILYEKTGEDIPSIAETEDDLQAMLDNAAAGSESTPTIIPVKNVTLTKPLVINGKYVTLRGGSLTSSNSSGLISIKNGGLILDNIAVSTTWTTTNVKFITVTGSGKLTINSNATIHSDSKYLSLIYVEVGGNLTSFGIITGNISSGGVLNFWDGIIHGQVSSSGTFNLSGTVKIDIGVYLLGNALIVMQNAPQYTLKILTDGKSSNVVVKGGFGFVLSQSYLSKFVCTIENLQFIWKNDQIWVVEKQSTVSKVTWNTITGVTLKPESGYNASSIVKGGDFKFKITCPSDKKVVVKNGSTLLTPDVLGVYTLSNIQTNIQLTITMVDKAGYTITIPKSVPGLIIQLPDGFTGNVKEGDNFKFKADQASDRYTVGVKVDGQYIYRDYDGTNATFNVYDIRKDIVVEIEAIDISSLNTTKIVTTTADHLYTHFTDRECCYTQKLIVKGSIDVMDLIYMSDLPEVRSIDLSESIISGNKLTEYKLCFMYKLSEIIFPASITEIGDNNILYNVNLTRVVMNSIVPPILGSNTFNGILASQITIFVPYGSGYAYRKAPVWKNFNIVEMIPDTYTVTLPSVTGFEIKPFAGYDASSVMAGDDFKFSVLPKAGYEQYRLAVYVNNKLLLPAAGSIYTIQNVTVNQIVKVEVTPPSTENTYRILWQADDGATLVSEIGYNENEIREGDDFKFHILLDALHLNWEVRVQINGITLSPDAWGIYTISDIRSDTNIVITLTEIFNVTFVEPVENIRMVAETGYDPDRILAGNDFKFHLDSKYSSYQLKVWANGELLVSVNSVYTIYNMYEDKSIIVTVTGSVGNEEIQSNQVFITIVGGKVCISHPEMKNTPLYITSFNGTVVKVGMLNGVYTEIGVPAKGAYVISFDGFSRKIIVK